MKKILIAKTIFVSLLLGLCIYQVSALNLEAAWLQKQEKQLGALLQEQEGLQRGFAQTNSLDNLKDLVQELNFEAINEVSYIQALEASVAAR